MYPLTIPPYYLINPALLFHYSNLQNNKNK